jgi:hypothetical protein
MGFGAVSDPPADTVSQALEQYAELDRRMHERHMLGALGNVILNRIARIAQGTWAYAGLPVIFLFAASAGLPRGVFRVAGGTAVAVFAAYLAYGHIASWTVYYLELQAPLAFLTAVGILVVTKRVGPRLSGRVFFRHDPAAAQRALFLLGAALLLVPAVVEARWWRASHIADRALVEAFDRTIEPLAGRPAIAFVRERADLHPERTVVDNVIDLNSAPLWVVHDRGAENARLLSLAPSRMSYLITETRERDSIVFRVTSLDR